MGQIFGIILTIAIFAAIATVGIALALVLLGFAAAGWVYMKITGKHPLEKFFVQAGQEVRAEEHTSEIIEAEYKVIEDKDVQ